MQTFCTYFDSNYLDRGLCLWRSLKKFQPLAKIFVCCLDDKTYDILMSLRVKDVTPVRLNQVESKFPELSAAKENRSKVEYYFTITPSWIRYVFESYDDLELLTYLDSDLFFFSDPQPLFNEMADKLGHVAIIGHRFTSALQHLSIYGLYNVGWVSFRRTPTAMICLFDWQRKCIEWCHDYVEDDRFADQKYLDAWPSRHQGVVVLDHPGANVALWNIDVGAVKRRRSQIEVHGQPLIFYHFHGLSQISHRLFFTNTRIYNATLNWVLRYSVYGPYMTALRQMQHRLSRNDIRPLIRYKHSAEDIAFARRNPFVGVFLYSVFGIALP